MDGYTPLAQFWAAQGFGVIQPTFLDSTRLGPNPTAHTVRQSELILTIPESLPYGGIV